MRKLLLLTAFLSFSIFTNAQINTALFEDFEAPSLEDKVDSTYSVQLNNMTVSNNWPFSISQQVSTSGTNCYKAQGKDGNSSFFRTISFSTIGNRYTKLTFNHIAKVSNLNQCRLDYSVDGGQSWSPVPASAYNGPSVAFQVTGYFNESSYFTLGDPWFNGVYTGANSIPNNSWWRNEVFDLSDLVYDVPNNTGYANVMVRFEMRVTQSTPNNILPAGWFIDDIEITQASCELVPPSLDFSFIPNPCYPPKPEGGIPQRLGDKYPVAVEATDASGISSVEVFYRKTQPPGQPFTSITLGPAGSANRYRDTIYNVFVGDTIEYYFEVADGSCPNISIAPSVGDYCKFWPEPSLPPKCGMPNCNQFPEVISSFPWTEDFESSRWIAGNGGASTTGGAHRGVFPVFPIGAWTVTPSTASANDNRFAWCINSGATSTAATGPLSNHTTGGTKYVYVESSLGTPVAGAQFITPCIDLTEETRCLGFEFWYHMFGSDVDLLRIDIDTGSSGPAYWVNYAQLQGQKQSLGTDPWKRFLFSLEPFNGQYIRIRFFAVKRNAGARGDIALDDMRIFVPDPVDIEMQTIDEPENGYCFYTANEPVTVTLINNGCQTATEIPVAFQVNNNAVKWDTIQANLSLGDTMSYTYTPTADLSAYDSYWISAWSAMPNDVNTGNDMVMIEDSIEYNIPITSFPYIEGFEDGIRQSQVLGNRRFRFDDGLINFYRWIINEGLTPTRSTGPFQGFGYGGKYLYSESLANDNQESDTYFRSVCVDLTGMTDPVLEFYYHMYGNAIKSLEVQVSKSDENLETWTTLPSSTINGSQQTGELQYWRYKKVSLSNYLGQTVKLRFKASRNQLNPMPSNGDQTDIAIDKIMIFDEIANDAGAFEISAPVLHLEAGSSFDPVIRITNHGDSPLNGNVPVTVSITPLCGPNAGQTTTYTGSAAVPSLASGAASGQRTLSNFNIAWPNGEFEMCVITQLAGDSHAFNDTICKRLIGHGSYNIAYEADFDDCDYSQDEFYYEGTFRQWELGRPGGTRIRNAYSAPNAWVTNLDGGVLNGTDEYLYIPELNNFDTIVKPRFRFRHNMDFAANPDDKKTSKAVGSIEYLDTVTNQWKVLGADLLGIVIKGVRNLNWYDSEFGSSVLFEINSEPGFVGRTNGGWIQTSYVLAEFDETPGPKNFRFRYTTAADGNSGNEGWGIDDFELYVPPQNSTGVIRINHVSPIAFPKTTQDLKLVIQNTGAKELVSTLIQIYIEDSLLVDTLYVPDVPMFTSQKKTLIFDDAWPADLVSVGLHKVEVFTSRPNAKRDNFMPDDDTTVYFTVLDTVDLRAPVTEYCSNFERNNTSVSPWLPTNSYTYSAGSYSWEWGFPAQFGLPPSGNDAWVTKTNDKYSIRDSSSLISPIFVIDSGQSLEVSFSHWFRTEQYHDGGNFEVSFDGGLKWQPVGYRFDKDSISWYNTPFVTALDIIRPGWSGDAAGWVNSNWIFAFDNDVKCIFRFRFESDYSIQDDGWAIDDFCLKHSNKAPRQVIGQEENELIEESITSELSPNPSRGLAELGLYIPTPKDAQMVVINSVGQLMEERDLQLENGNNIIQLNGSNWESGLYIIKIYVEGDVITKKLIISH
mgnify:CR=1 FL=1